MFLLHPRVKVSIVGSLRDREVACSASDRQGTNFESCVWRTVSSQPPQEVLLAQFSLYVHKGGLKLDSFLFYQTPIFPGTRFVDPMVNFVYHIYQKIDFQYISKWPSFGLRQTPNWYIIRRNGSRFVIDFAGAALCVTINTPKRPD